jgi:hypothetical protein
MPAQALTSAESGQQRQFARSARHRRFHVRFTPTGCSWINQVGLWFAYLTARLVQCGVYKDVQAMEGHRDLDSNMERGPQPFVWKKAAEGILTSLANCLNRI